jgi:benzoyl-CoA reductase subunit C
MFTKFRELIEERHRKAREWKESGERKIVGYLCTYSPEEIVHASGAVPVRIVGSGEPISLADAHVQSFYCTFSRGFLDECLKGSYDYLDGLIGSYSCDHYHTAFEIWQRNRPVFFSRILDMPSRVDTPEARTFFVEEMKLFKEKIGEAFGKEIDDGALRDSIGVYNTNRTLLKEMYGLRRQDPPAVTGTEALEVVLAGMYTPKEDHSRLLEELLGRIKDREACPAGAVRLMVVGSELDDSKVYRLIEELGAVVVTDDICTGTRYLWDLTPEEGDPVEAVADRYLSKIPCPVKHPTDARFEHIESMVREFNVQGVVIIIRKFCNPHEWDNPRLTEFLRKLGVPYTQIELDTTFSSDEVQSKVQGLMAVIGGRERCIRPNR